METGKEAADHRRKRVIQVLFIVFIGGLLLFTFFSNTLKSITLPKVSVEKPVRGSLVHTFEGVGVLKPLVEAKLINPSGWKVQKVLVKEGDHVKKGQTLVLYDSKTAERELEDEASNLDKQKIELMHIQDQFIQSATEGDEFKIRDAKRAIESHKLDLTIQERKIAGLREQLASQKQLTAPYGGIITKVNAVKGMGLGGDPDVVISNSSSGYQFELSMDGALLELLGLKVGDKLEFQVSASGEAKTFKSQGAITEVKSVEPRMQTLEGVTAESSLAIPQKTLRIHVVDSKLQGGEQALLKLEKPSSNEGFIVTQKAVRQERDGLYIFKVEEQKGALGNVFVVRKVRLTSVETNGKDTMVQSENLYEEDQIILESSEPLQDGDRIRLQ